MEYGGIGSGHAARWVVGVCGTHNDVLVEVCCEPWKHCVGHQCRLRDSKACGGYYCHHQSCYCHHQRFDL